MIHLSVGSLILSALAVIAMLQNRDTDFAVFLVGSFVVLALSEILSELRK